MNLFDQWVEEVLHYVDKIVALALRVGRIKFRDVWDLHWLRQQNTALRGNWILPKVAMHGHSAEDFRDALLTRLNLLSENSALQKEGWKELSRFLLHEQISGLVDQPDFWRYLCSELKRDLSSIL